MNSARLLGSLSFSLQRPLDFSDSGLVALGAIARKPAVVGERVELREFLGMTLMFDHDVIDGAPMATFLQRLRELIKSECGL